jgi:hypothetical protein
MQEVVKRITILKTIKEGTINYNMQVDTSIDKDELVGILTQMTQTVIAQNMVTAVLPVNGKDKKPGYIG